MSELPQGWETASFSDVVVSFSNGIGGDQNKDGIGIPVSRIETIADQSINFKRVGYIADYDATKINKYQLKCGDILFSHINSPIHLGKTAIFDRRRYRVRVAASSESRRPIECRCGEAMDQRKEPIRPSCTEMDRRLRSEAADPRRCALRGAIRVRISRGPPGPRRNST